jgi:hypothetical protein
MSGPTLLFYAGELALGILAYSLFLLVAGLAVGRLQRLWRVDRILPPREVGCLLAGTAWVFVCVWLSHAFLQSPLVRVLLTPWVSPGVVAIAAPLKAWGADPLSYATQILLAGWALDAAGYSLICYALCKFVRPKRRIGPTAAPGGPDAGARQWRP